jgi:hypothetical protein
MTTRNVPESSVGSHRFVSRPVAQSPIIGLVRRGNVPLGHRLSRAVVPIFAHEFRRAKTERLASKRMGSEVKP